MEIQEKVGLGFVYTSELKIAGLCMLMGLSVNTSTNGWLGCCVCVCGCGVAPVNKMRLDARDGGIVGLVSDLGFR